MHGTFPIPTEFLVDRGQEVAGTGLGSSVLLFLLESGHLPVTLPTRIILVGSELVSDMVQTAV